MLITTAGWLLLLAAVALVAWFIAGLDAGGRPRSLSDLSRQLLIGLALEHGMARRGSTEVIRVWYVATLATPSAPSAAAVTAGVDLTPFLTRDGLTTPNSGSTLDVSDASSRQNKTAAGTFGGDPIELKLNRDDTPANDTAWVTLPRGTAGYIVVRRFGGSAVAATAAQKVEVWPVEVISRENAPIAENAKQMFTARCAIPGAVFDDATLAA
ncbi:hypothetical protein [Iamia sp.]|uniref:phage tail tube protein n=1 Tax=Iamia sp. TaxID=2722710 RepID=UPI002BDF42FC|nr:hypothetical protein [Iamia sp.]HXH57724.1 hypothetical protein [Iamia sp.]